MTRLKPLYIHGAYTARVLDIMRMVSGRWLLVMTKPSMRNRRQLKISLDLDIRIVILVPPA